MKLIQLGHFALLESDMDVGVCKCFVLTFVGAFIASVDAGAALFTERSPALSADVSQTSLIFESV